MPVLNDRDHPALWLVLNQNNGTLLDDGKPFTCEGCPKGTLDDVYSEVCNDLSEAHYKCSFFPGERVWGENPKCTRKQWQEAAVAELAAVGVLFKSVQTLVQEVKDQHKTLVLDEVRNLDEGKVLVLGWDGTSPVAPTSVRPIVQDLLKAAAIQADKKAQASRKAPYTWDGKLRSFDRARVTEEGLVLEWNVPEIGMHTYLAPWNDILEGDVV